MTEKNEICFPASENISLNLLALSLLEIMITVVLVSLHGMNMIFNRLEAFLTDNMFNPAGIFNGNFFRNA